MDEKNEDQFFHGGWAWMSHPSYNDGNAIPVKMEEEGGVRYYYPLDPIDATDFEWDRRDSEWQMIVPPIPAPLVEKAMDMARMLKELIQADRNGDLTDALFKRAATLYEDATGEAA